MGINPPSTRIYKAISAATLVSAALLTVSAHGAGDDESVLVPKDEICDHVVCREPTTVRLWADDGTVLEGTLPPGPYVLDGVVNVLAGESFKVEAADTGTRFLTLRYADSDGDPARTLTVGLEQSLSDSGNEMIFSIENPLPYPVKFRLAANAPGSPDLVYTRTCPVAPGEWSFEKWQGPIAQLVVFDVQILDSESPMATACD